MKHFANMREICVFIFKVIWPLFYIISIIVGCDWFIKNDNPYLLFGIKIIIIIIASLPLLYIVNKRSGIFDLLGKTLKGKLVKAKSNKSDL